MKKASIITAVICVLLMIVWVFCALIYCAFNDSPVRMPHIWNILLAIPFSIFLICCVVFIICIRSVIINEIKQLLKETN